jgi:hypothetical protein
MITNPLAPGSVTSAEYIDQDVSAFRGNPFLEALPPLLSGDELRRRMAYYPSYDPAVRERPPEIRRMEAGGLLYYRHPVGVHLEMAFRLTNLLRWGYVARNPIHPGFQASVHARTGALEVLGKKDKLLVGSAGFGGDFWPSATGLTLLGITGIGKTAITEMWMKLYPQMIVHTEYGGRPFINTQIVYLRLQCPKDGSIHTLIRNFFLAIDALHRSVPIETNYQRWYLSGRTTIQELIPKMALLAAQHGLGLLILDEVQDLSPRGAAPILSFLVQLVNTIGVPVVLVGGLEALPVLTAQFRQARRGATEGDMIVGRAELGDDWRKFCEPLWKYQYTRDLTPLTDDILEALYEESQGITQYLVLLHKLAQERAIATGLERITPGLIRSVAKDSLTQARPVLRAIGRGNKEFLRRMPDVEGPDGYEAVPFVRGTPPVRAPGSEVTVAAPKPKRAPRRESAGKAATVSPSTAVAPERGDALLAGGMIPLPELVRDARDRGDDAHAALTSAGLVGDRLWKQIAGPDWVAARGA